MAIAGVLLFLHFSLAISSSTLSLQPPDTSYPSTMYTSFRSFNDTNDPNFIISSEAAIRGGAIQLTPETQNDPEKNVANRSGRVLFNQKFKIWDFLPSNSTTKLVASFNTSFEMNVLRSKGTSPGEGLAFLITSDTSGPPPGSDGGFLGLTNLTSDGNSSNNLVAIEFDTFQDQYDPNSNHVGLDINSVHSSTTADLGSFGIEISPVLPANWTVWIDYDGHGRHISVYMNTTGSPKPASPVLNASLDLSEHLPQWSYFGFAGSTGTNYELNCILAWNLTVQNLQSQNIPEAPRPQTNSRTTSSTGWSVRKHARAAGVPSVVAVAVLGLLVAYYCFRRKGMGNGTVSMSETLRSLPGTPHEFKYKNLKQATNNFDERLKLGQGGFGVVYKGLIRGEKVEIAVKKFSREGTSCRDDFLKELTIINCLRHKNLVPLIGWSYKKGMLLLVYEFMPNGSLDQHLYGGPERLLLSWERRWNILAGLSSALHYLHDEYDQMVIHRDLKPSNVMLDAAFNARLGDFGLARALDTNKTSYTEQDLGGMPGTLGYIAPECFHTGKATRESDVFGLGVVVLEVVSGRRPHSQNVHLSDWVWKLYGEGRILEAADPRLAGNYVVEEAERLLQLGLSCSHPIPGERPRMQAVVQVLAGTVLPLQLPLFKPPFVWPAGDFGEVSSEFFLEIEVSSELTDSSIAS